MGANDQEFWCRNYIGGKWVPSLTGRTFTVFEHNNPTKPMDTFPDSNPGDCEKAFEAASRACAQFQKTSLDQRDQIFSSAEKLLGSRKQKIVDLIIREKHLPGSLAYEQVRIIRDVLRFFAGKYIGAMLISGLSPESVSIAKRDQVYLIAMQDNWPICGPFLKIIAILFSRHPVIFLPHEERSVSVTALIDLLVEAGFKDHPGALNLLHASAENRQKIMSIYS